MSVFQWKTTSVQVQQRYRQIAFNRTDKSRWCWVTLRCAVPVSYVFYDLTVKKCFVKFFRKLSQYCSSRHSWRTHLLLLSNFFNICWLRSFKLFLLFLLQECKHLLLNQVYSPVYNAKKPKKSLFGSSKGYVACPFFVVQFWIHVVRKCVATFIILLTKMTILKRLKTLYRF